MKINEVIPVNVMPKFTMARLKRLLPSFLLCELGGNFLDLSCALDVVVLRVLAVSVQPLPLLVVVVNYKERRLGPFLYTNFRLFLCCLRRAELLPKVKETETGYEAMCPKDEIRGKQITVRLSTKNKIIYLDAIKKEETVDIFHLSEIYSFLYKVIPLFSYICHYINV